MNSSHIGSVKQWIMTCWTWQCSIHGILYSHKQFVTRLTIRLVTIITHVQLLYCSTFYILLPQHIHFVWPLCRVRDFMNIYGYCQCIYSAFVWVVGCVETPPFIRLCCVRARVWILSVYLLGICLGSRMCGDPSVYPFALRACARVDIVFVSTWCLFG
jgi:hypothetical protein